MKASLRLYCGSIEALLRLFQGSIAALLRYGCVAINAEAGATGATAATAVSRRHQTAAGGGSEAVKALLRLY
jgi:hypothetical protein